MKKYTEKIASTDSKNNLNVIIWETEKEPIGVLQIVHGMAEYIDRYDNFAKYMTEQGFNIFITPFTLQCPLFLLQPYTFSALLSFRSDIQVL